MQLPNDPIMLMSVKNLLLQGLNMTKNKTCSFNEISHNFIVAEFFCKKVLTFRNLCV